MKKILLTILLCCLAMNMMAQNALQICSEQDIALSLRPKYKKQAQQFLENFYDGLLLNYDDEIIKDTYIENNMQAESKRYKPEFQLSLNKNLQYLTPKQYLLELDKSFKSMDVENLSFSIENIQFQQDFYKLGMASCYLVMNYDLTLSENGNDILFKRHCKAYCLFPNAMAYMNILLMQVEPVKDIIAYVQKTNIQDKSSVAVKDDGLTTVINEKLENGVETSNEVSSVENLVDLVKTAQDNAVSTHTDEHNGYQYVDLGLSVKWATCNLGATAPEESGHYFSWGEIMPNKNSKYTEKDSRTFNKPFQDISGNPSYDAARANMKGGWRIPTRDELKELVNKCRFDWDSEKKGYRITGPSGNSIFLPASGIYTSSKLLQVKQACNLWSSTPYRGKNKFTHTLFFNSENKYSIGTIYRYMGCNIRPVID